MLVWSQNKLFNVLLYQLAIDLLFVLDYDTSILFVSAILAESEGHLDIRVLLVDLRKNGL